MYVEEIMVKNKTNKGEILKAVLGEICPVLKKNSTWRSKGSLTNSIHEEPPASRHIMVELFNLKNDSCSII